MSNGFKKNLEVITKEWGEVGRQWCANTLRLKGASLRGDKTNVFHILQNYPTEFYRAVPRTLSYLTTITVLTGCVLWAI